MQIIFNSLYKIDIEANSVTPMILDNAENDLTGYVKELLTNILANSDKKSYEFESDTTEVRVLLDRILANDFTKPDNYHPLTRSIIDRLLVKEIAVQAKVKHLGTEILKGIVVVSLVRFENNSSKIIISKAENDDFIDSMSYLKRSGLPLRKKIYKAFIAEYNETDKVKGTSVYDTNSTFSVYWWRDFLELTEVYSNEYNTDRAFRVIQDKILTPVKKLSKPDYLNLWNSTIHYFRSKKEFSLNEFIDQIIKDYQPFDEKLKVNELEKKARSLAEKNKFDSRFEIIPGVVNKRFKNSIELTPQIELTLKQDIDNIQNTIVPMEDEAGDKWVMIKSDTGYEYFQNHLTNEKKKSNG